MSRHVIRSDSAYTVVVGWDPPMGSYFAQVFDNERSQARRDADADDLPVLDLGDPWDVIDSTEALAGFVSEYATLDSTTQRTLIGDRRRDR